MINRYRENTFHQATILLDRRISEEIRSKANKATILKSGEANKLVIAGLENIANETGCSKKTLYKWIRHRHFPAFKMDGVWRAMRKDIEAWFDTMRHQ